MAEVATAVGLSPLRPSDPRQLGPWAIRGRLGEGGMGVVFLGTRRNEVAALKTIQPNLLDDLAFRRRFEREAQAARSVSSPRVAALVDAHLDGDRAYLAFEYVEGATLTAYISRRGALAGDELVAFALALADGLRAVHAAGVTHRDVKPANLICTESGPVIIDFGVASVAEATSLTATGLTIGSVGWMAPEQAAGQSVSAATDMFSWAATVAFAASGEPPFGVGRADAVIYRILHSEPSLPSMPAGLDELVQRAFVKDPAVRPSSAEVVTTLIGDSATASPVEDRVTAMVRESWTTPLPTAQPTVGTGVLRAGRRRLRHLAISGVAVVALVALVGGLLRLTADDGQNELDDPDTAAASSVVSTSTGDSSISTTTTMPIEWWRADSPDASLVPSQALEAWRSSAYGDDCPLLYPVDPPSAPTVRVADRANPDGSLWELTFDVDGRRMTYGDGLDYAEQVAWFDQFGWDRSPLGNGAWLALEGDAGEFEAIATLGIPGSACTYTVTSDATSQEIEAFVRTLRQVEVPGGATATSMRDVDFSNWSYEVECFSDEPTGLSVSLRDGRWQRNQDPANGVVTGADVLYIDFVPGADEEAVVSVTCAMGAGTQFTNTFVFEAASGRPVATGPVIWGYPVRPSESIDGGIEVFNPIYNDGSPRCCPDAYQRSTWAWSGSSIAEIETKTVSVEEVPFPDG